jgi:hypothetical protein
MSDDRFFERLRQDAQPLRYEASDAAVTRIAARVRARVAATPPPSISQWLANWFRPLSVSLAGLALATSLGLAWYDAQEPVSIETTIAQNNVEVSMGGLSLGE